MAYILALVLTPEKTSFKFDTDFFANQLPFIYSCISFLGVLLLLGKFLTLKQLHYNLHDMLRDK